MHRFISRALPVCLGVALAALGALPAAATTLVSVSGYTLDTPGYRLGTIKVGTTFSEDAAIGRIQLTGSRDGVSFTTRTYCVDVFDWLHAGTFEEGKWPSGAAATTKQAAITTLLAHVDPLSTAAPSQVVDANSSAAVQMAIWEILNETSSAYDVTSGYFRMADNPGFNNTAGFNAATSLANGYLANLPAWTAAGTSTRLTLRTLTASGNQTQLGAAVPETATWAMMIVGFGAIGAGMRRRRPAVTMTTPA